MTLNDFQELEKFDQARIVQMRRRMIELGDDDPIPGALWQNQIS
jgi:hypothetical protein